MNKKTLKKYTAFLFAIFLAAVGAVHADVAPDPGFKRVTINLSLETTEDFSDYRFFIESALDISEVSVKKGETSEVSPMGGGAAYAFGTLWAIPVKSLSAFGDDLNSLKQAVRDGKVEGAIELLQHNFRKTVPEREADNQKAAKYRLERDKERGVKAAAVDAESKPSADSAEVSSPVAKSWISMVVAGFLLAVGVVFLGFQLFRK
jgi:hypothetical protein